MGEPANNEYCRFRVLRRTDGASVVYDPDEWPPVCTTYTREAAARAEALKRSRAVDPSYTHPPDAATPEELRSWSAARPHVAWCTCSTCAATKRL